MGGTALLIILYFAVPQGESIFQFKRISEYIVFYWIGYLFEYRGMREKLFSNQQRCKIIYCIFLFIASIVLTYLGHNIGESGLLEKLIKFVNALTGTAFIFMIVSCINAEELKRDSLFTVLSRRNFDVYLYHEPLQFLILFAFNAVGILGTFNSNIGYGLLVCIRFIISISLSIAIGVIISKAKMSFKRRG